jgi:hypothetical protein
MVNEEQGADDESWKAKTQRMHDENTRRLEKIEEVAGKNIHGGLFAKLASSIGGAAIAAIIGFFVWLAHVSNRLSVIEEVRIVEREAAQRVDKERIEAARRVEDATKESLSRIEHEREANDARVRDDLREIRAKVFK